MACEHAPVWGHCPREFAVEGWGASGPEFLLHALPSHRLFSRAGRAGQVKGIDHSCKIGYLLWEVRYRDRGASSRHEVGDLPVIVSRGLCYGFTGWCAWPGTEAIENVNMGSGKCDFGLHSAALHPCNRVEAWAALRHDDLRGIRPRDFVVSAGSLRGEVWRSKATGCDKMVQSRPIIITPMSDVPDSGWLLDGLQLLLDLCSSLRGFLLPTSIGGATSSAFAPLTLRGATTLSLYLASHLRRPVREGLPLFHAGMASGFWMQHSGRSFLATSATCLGNSAADLVLLGWLAGAGRCCLWATSTREGQPDSVSCPGVFARGEAHGALVEPEALQVLSTRLRNRWVSETEIDEQVEENFLGGQLLGESVGAPADDELFLAGGVLGGGFPSRAAPGSTLPYLAEVAGVHTGYDRVRGQRLHRSRGFYRFPLADYTEVDTLVEVCLPRSSSPAFADVVSRQALLGHKTLAARAQSVPALPVKMREVLGNVWF